MPTVTLTVKYVNPPKPGKQRGSIKCTDDTIYGVFPDKMHLFEAGKTYEIDYSEKSVDGVTYRTVKSAVPLASGAPNTSSSSKPAAYGSYRETSARDAERMFVCSILNAGITSQQIEFNRQRIGAAVTALRGIWQETFGADEASVSEPAPAASLLPTRSVPPRAAVNGHARVPTNQFVRDEIPF